jgi:hypothetical protein
MAGSGKRYIDTRVLQIIIGTRFTAAQHLTTRRALLRPARHFLKESNMQDPGHLIATYFVLLYTILGPLVLFAIYVLFDFLTKSGRPNGRQPGTPADKSDPALWTTEDINAHLDRF